jgi:nitroimidazol reductase NimA-like FMN-containing flavoprotein (pyridoxamine 5'-phosphate oxidase superfamily)
VRRCDKEINSLEELESIIRKGEICRLAMVDNGRPYIVPMHYGYDNGALYFHSAPEGRKLDIIRAAPEVCFEIETGVEIVTAEKPCGWGTKFRSVIGYGTASFTEDAAAKAEAMARIMEHYTGSGSFSFSEKEVSGVTAFSVSITSMTGKRSPAQ